MRITAFQTEPQRGKHKPTVVLLAAVSASLLAAAVTVDGAGSSDDVETSPPSSATAPMPMEHMVARAADKAALIQLCLRGLDDPAAAADYEQARVAHPGLAEGIGPECQLVSD